MKNNTLKKLRLTKGIISNLEKINGGIQAESDDPKSQSLCQSAPDCRVQ